MEERVGRQLAVIGDEVDSQYASLFSKMIDTLSVSDNTPYDNFADVARSSVLIFSILSLSLSLSLYGCVCASVYLARRLKSLIYHFNHLIKQKLTSSSLMFCSSVLELQSVKVMITVL